MDQQDFDPLLRYFEINGEELDMIAEKKNISDVLAGFYFKLHEKTNKQRYLDVSERVARCNSFWFFDRYNGQGILDLQSVSLCGNRLCPNCAKLRQLSLMGRFYDRIKQTAEHARLLLCTCTIRNVPGPWLSDTVTAMAQAFTRMMKYFSGEKTITGLDFKQYGYVAALRACEITYNKYGDMFHPHIHFILALRPDFDLGEKTHKNKYSYDRVGKEWVFKRWFSDWEIMLQKLWRLSYDTIVERNERQRNVDARMRKIIDKLGRPLDSVEQYQLGLITKAQALKLAKAKSPQIRAAKITADMLNNLNIGYSCTADYVKEDKYFEVFKYAVKFTGEDDQLMGYEQFEYLQTALDGRKIIQGYGEWYDFKDDGIDQRAIFAVFRRWLQTREKPQKTMYTLEGVQGQAQTQTYLMISQRQCDQNPEKMQQLKAAYPEFVEYLMASEYASKSPPAPITDLQHRPQPDEYYSYDDYARKRGNPAANDPNVTGLIIAHDKRTLQRYPVHFDMDEPAIPYDPPNLQDPITEEPMQVTQMDIDMLEDIF